MKKKTFHFVIALSMFILFVAQLLRLLENDSGPDMTFVIVAVALFGLALAHLVIGFRKRTE